MGMRVKRTAPFVMGFKSVLVKPGLNNFTDAEAKVLRGDPAFQEQIDLGYQEVVGEGAEMGDSLADSILQMSAKKAIKAVKDTLDIAVLEDLQDREERATVLKAVEDQIAMLKDEE